MISIIQRADGTVQLNFPYINYMNNIPDGMIVWLTENTERKWIYNKWSTNVLDSKIGIEITKEDLTALKLKFPL